MKSKVILLALLVAASNYANAECLGSIVNGRCLGPTVNYGGGYNNSSDRNESYKSRSGAEYQYNLNNPGDSIRYSTDLGAQRRDQMSANPRRDLDRRVGEIGGGIHD